VAFEIQDLLLERERELGAVSDALRDAGRGRGRAIFVEAPAGLGKTSLLRAASEEAAETGFTCLRARAGELERDFAYGCVRQLLEPAVARLADPERLFEGAAAHAKPLFASGRPTTASPPADSSFAILHGLYWLLGNLSDRGPVVLVMDDLHWSDPESLQFLNYLIPRLEGVALALLASARTGEAMTADLVRLAANPETTVLRLPPLSTAATATLCEQRLGGTVAEGFAAACHEATGGNPFFLEALLREGREQRLSGSADDATRVASLGPAAVAQAVLLRLSGAPAAATALVRAVAVLGDGARVAEAAGLAELSEEEASRTADLLSALAILKPAERLEFAHPIVREAVYADMGPHERARAHARAVRILAAGGAAEERIAAQIAESQPVGDAWRVELLRRVAAEALVRGAPGAAVVMLRRALSEPPPSAARVEVLAELGTAEYRLGVPEAVEHLSAAVALTRDPRLLARSVHWLANALTMAGDSDRAVEAIEAAIEVVEPEDRELALELEAELAAHAQEAGLERRAPAARRLERHAGLEGATPGERAVLASLAFERARGSHSASEAAGHLERALAGGRLWGREVDVSGTFYLLLVGLLATDALDLADACLKEALADARAVGSIPPLAFLIEFRGWVSLRRGAVADAETDARTALELLTARGIELGSAFALALLIEALIEEGELVEAERALRGSGIGEDIPPGLAINDLLEARGLLRIAQGRSRDGLADLQEFGRRDELWGGASPLASRWRSRAALALAATGDEEGARRLADLDLERARRWGAPSGVGVALRAAALAGGGTVALERLQEAADVLEGAPARLEFARALTDLGAALRRANRRADARRALQDGLDLAAGCGAHALAGRAGEELAAAGGRSSQIVSGGVEWLTASERRVAALAAEGRSNPEIAQALFVTRKTVETHLGRVYRKLDIAGRGELPKALAAPDIGEPGR
jgi:DNA-binding CsgD family transcriptional regulator